MLVAASRFCHQCGAPAQSAAPIGERRRVSILFADLSGYTAMSEKHDPETVRTVVEAALGRLSEEVVRHGGHVDKFIGDNVMALFGAPVAHEDDPLRAVRTGLAMQDAMEEINQHVRTRIGHELRLCVGVNTGEVMAGSVGNSYTVVGDAVNVAARLQGAAVPGDVLVGPETHQATAGQVEYDEVGSIALKGKADTVAAWRALLVRPTGERRPSSTPPLVGRSAELAQLEALHHDAVTTGRATLATVLGEPGVGKSRLARELAERLPGARALWGVSVPYGSGSAYFAVGAILQTLFGIAEDDAPDHAADKLRGSVDDERSYAVLAPLVGATVVDPVSDDPAVIRGETFAAVRLALSRAARVQPLLLVLEDLHWADGGVVDLVDYLADSLDAPALVVCLARPELIGRAPTLAGSDNGRAVLRLGPLSTREVVELVAATTGDGTSAATDAIVARSGGIPLFVEEMVRHLGEVGGEGLAELPRTLQGLLVARLDLLDPEERRLLQRASVIGASFTSEDLDDPVTDPPAAVPHEIVADRLCAKGFLRRGHEQLHFNHVLMRDAAYSLLPKAERARRHMEVAARMESRGGMAESTEIAVVAEHYLQAAMLAEAGYLDDVDKERARAGALRHLLAAGDRAGSLSSDTAALAQYEAALSLTPSAELLVDLSERIGDAAMRLGEPGRAIEAWLRAQALLPETSVHRLAELDRRLGRAYLQLGERERAIERYQFGINRLVVLGPDSGLIHLYEDSALLYSEAGENMLAIYNGERALAVAEQLQMVSAASRARGVFGLVLGRLGNAEAARQSFETALLPSSLDEGTRATLLRAYARHLRLHVGDTGSARERLDEALALADQLGDVPLQVDIAGELAQIALDAGEWGRVAELTTTCEQLRNTSGYTGRRALPLRLRAWSAAVAGDVSTGRRLFRQSYENAVATGDAEEAVAALRGIGVVELSSGSAGHAVGHLRDAQRLCDAGDMRSAYVDVAALLVVALALGGQHGAATAALHDARDRAGPSSLPAARAALLEAEGVLTRDADMLAEATARWAALGRSVDADRSRAWSADGA